MTDVGHGEHDAFWALGAAGHTLDVASCYTLSSLDMRVRLLAHTGAAADNDGTDRPLQPPASAHQNHLLPTIARRRRQSVLGALHHRRGTVLRPALYPRPLVLLGPPAGLRSDIVAHGRAHRSTTQRAALVATQPAPCDLRHAHRATARRRYTPALCTTQRPIGSTTADVRSIAHSAVPHESRCTRVGGRRGVHSRANDAWRTVDAAPAHVSERDVAVSAYGLVTACATART